MTSTVAESIHESNGKHKTKSNSGEYIGNSSEIVFKQVEENKSERIIVLCINLTEVKTCTSTLNAKTSVKFTSIDEVSNRNPSSVNHLVIDFASVQFLPDGFRSYKKIIIWNL